MNNVECDLLEATLARIRTLCAHSRAQIAAKILAEVRQAQHLLGSAKQRVDPVKYASERGRTL